MPTSPTPQYVTPFGKNVYLRSTRNKKVKSAMFAHDSLPTVMIDGHEQRVLQPGTVLAEITSGPDIGKVGVFQDAGSGAVEIQTITEATAITAGTYTITLFPGTSGEVTTDDIAFNANAATVQAAVRAAVATSDDVDYADLADDITVTGGPVDTAPLTVNYGGGYGQDVPQLTVDQTALTGTVTVATTQAGAAGAVDGRQTVGNIVGICDTFLPSQLLHRDVEVAVVYDAAVVQANCIKLDASGAPVALDDTTAAAMVAQKALNITFHTASSEI